ncbi:MAG TPA: hypothetical protein ENK57_09095 [Polyangiaceae bacterium]|nr:hypothetical protein [Polyangiaceae bacterium]
MSGTFESRRIEVDAPITASEAGSSQLTGIGAVQSVRLRPSTPPPKSKRSLAYVAVGLAAAFVVGVVAFTGGDEESEAPSAAAESGAAPDAEEPAADEKAPVEEPPPTASSVAKSDVTPNDEQVEDAKVASDPDERDTEAAEPTPSAKPGGVRPTVKVVPKTPRPAAPQPAKGSPFGYEPDDL